MIEAIAIIALFTAFFIARTLLVARAYARKAAGQETRQPVITPYVGARYNAHGREVRVLGNPAHRRAL